MSKMSVSGSRESLRLRRTADIRIELMPLLESS